MHRSPLHSGAQVPKKALSFNKVFRWEAPAGVSPTSVEITATFSQWQAIPLKKDGPSNAWQLSLNNIPGNCTHKYMILVDGQPASDPHADGLTLPETEQEKKWALTTARGPRLFMLFSQTK